MIEKRLLIVDDDKTVLFAYEKLFQFAGVIVDTARNMEKAEQLMKTNVYRALVTDLKLSTNNTTGGLQVLENMKKNNPQTKLILITGYGSPEVQQRAKELGVDYYFEKPVPIDNLIQILKSLVEF